MTAPTCTADSCRRTDHVGRGLCGKHYQAAWKADTLPPKPPKPDAGPHRCERGHAPSRTCYVGCACRCQDCRDETAAYARKLSRDKAYGRYIGYVDAEPVRAHVRALMAPKVGSSRGMGWKRIARTAGVPNGVVTKLLYGDPTRGAPPSRRLNADNAEKLLAVTRDLADGANVPAGPTRRRIAALVEGGWAKAEIARILAGDPHARALQVAIPRSRYVTAGHARQIDELHRRWKAGQIIPRGRWHPRWHGPKPITPKPAPPRGPVEIVRHRCEACGAPSLAGGRWCWPCFRVHAHREAAA